MNAPGQKFVDLFSTGELKPLAPVFLRGAYIVYAHSVLQRECGLGYLSAWAEDSFPSLAAKNDFFAAAGRALQPSDREETERARRRNDAGRAPGKTEMRSSAMTDVPTDAARGPAHRPRQARTQRRQARSHPGRRQLLAKVEAVGLCFSDLKLLKQFSQHARKSGVASGMDAQALAEMPNYVPGEKPAVPGHEAVVRIVKVGPGVDSLQGRRAFRGPDRLSVAADGEVQRRFRLQFRRRAAGIRAVR